MARPSKLTPADMPKARLTWSVLIERLCRAGEDESFITDQLRLQLMTRGLHKLLESPPVIGHTFEFSLGQFGIVDLLTRHQDGGYSLIEVKGPVANRDLGAGVGQLFLYEAGLRRRLQKEGDLPPYINKVLCAPMVDAARVRDILDVCNRAGVRFIAMPCSEQVRVLAREMFGGLIYGA